MRKPKKYNFIYKTTNNISGKFYIGMHSTDNLDDGYLGSGTRLRYSVRKYGKENHTREILEFCDSKEELQKRETEIVNEQLLKNKDCMNLTLGGGGGFWHVDPSENNRKRWNSEERIKLLENARNNLVLGRKKFKELMENEEYRKSFLEIALRNGLGNKSKLGQKDSIKTKKLKSKGQKGNKNSQFGKVWIYSHTEKRNMKVAKEQLTNYLEKGWIKGRKIKLK